MGGLPDRSEEKQITNQKSDSSLVAPSSSGSAEDTFDRKWGKTFLTEVPSDTVLSILTTAAAQIGYKVELDDSYQNHRSFRMELYEPLWRILLRRLPSEVVWRIWRSENRTLIYCDSKLSIGYILISVLLSALAPLLLYIAWTNAFHADLRTSSILTVYCGWTSLLLSVITLLAAGYLSSGLSMQRLQQMFGPLRDHAMATGSFLDPVGPQLGRRYAIHIIGYSCFLFLVSAIFLLSLVFEAGLRSIDWKVLFVLGIVVMLCLGCLLMIRSSQRIQGYGTRLLPAMGSLSICIALIFLAAVQVPWVLNEPEMSNYFSKFEVAQQYLRSKSKQPTITIPYSSTVQFNGIDEATDKMRLAAWILISASVFLMIAAARFAISAFNVTFESLPLLSQLKKRPDVDSSRRTADCASYLTGFRMTCGFVWAVIFICLVASFVGIARVGISLVESVSTQSASILHTVDLSALLATVALGVSPNNHAVIWTVRCIWAVYLLVCTGLLASGVGSFFVQEIRAHWRTVRAHAHNSRFSPRFIEQLAPHLCLLAEPPPQLILVSSSVPYAHARCLGLLRTHPLIEITTGCLEALSEDEAYALIAHEAAHHTLGHCRRDRFLRFLGRITFVGDGFVRVLQDTYGYELEADKFAVQKLGADPQSLIGCIKRLRILSALENLRLACGTTGLAVTSYDDSRDHVDVSTKLPITWWRRVVIGARLFYRHFLGIDNAGYWHPSVAHRIAALEGLRP